MRHARLAILTCCICVLAFGALAEPKEEPLAGSKRRGPDEHMSREKMERGHYGSWHGKTGDQDVRELVEMVMMARLSKKLELNDEQTVLLMRRFERAKEEVNKLREEKKTLLEDLEKAVDGADDDDAIAGKLAALTAVDAQMIEARQTMLQEVGADLTPTQQAKLYVSVQDFEDKMRGLVGRARGRHGDSDTASPDMESQSGPGSRRDAPGMQEGGPGLPGPGGPRADMLERRRLSDEESGPTRVGASRRGTGQGARHKPQRGRGAPEGSAGEDKERDEDE